MAPAAVAKDTSSTIMAHWQFMNDDNGVWSGFSPTVSHSLESAYISWCQDPQREKRSPSTVRSNQFKYVVNFFASTEVNGEVRKEQKLRRISLVEAETAQMVTVDQALWGGYKEELEALRAEREKESEAAKAEEEKQRGRILELESQVASLRAACKEQEDRARRLQDDLEAERTVEGRSVPHLRATPFPGRLVTVTSGYNAVASTSAVPGGSLGRVRALEGTTACVDFPTLGLCGLWVPCEHLAVAVEAELLSRPGSRVAWVRDDGSRAVGVVCDPVDEVTVNVLGADGRKHACCLQRLDLNEYAREASEPLEVGDLVVRRGSGHHRVGMVVRAIEDSVCVRFRAGPEEEGWEGADEEAGGCPALNPARGADAERQVDLCFSLEEAAGALRRVDEAGRVRPLSSVRFRRDVDVGALRAADQSEVGIAYAVHADGTAVVDFLGNAGCRCGVELLEVVPHRTTLDHAVLSLLSECLSWHEVSAERCEEERDACLLQMLEDALPLAQNASAAAGAPALAAAGQAEPVAQEQCRVTSWAPRTDVFRFVAKLLLTSARWGWQAQECDGSVFLGSVATAPLFCVERVEQIGNSRLQRLYALVQGRRLAESAALPPPEDGEEEEEIAAACGMPPGPSAHEAYLWWAASGSSTEAAPGGGDEGALAPSTASEAAERACLRGFAAERGPRGAVAHFFASAADADHSAGTIDGSGLRCLVLARVLLDRGHPDAPSRRGEHVLRNSSHALPLFRVFYRHM